MAVFEFVLGLTALNALFVTSQARGFHNEDLILCDCGIGDNSEHPKWSTSRQMNWYKNLKWPKSAYTYPEAPDNTIEVPYNDGSYPWNSEGASATMPNGDTWTAYIKNSTPDGFKAGNAISANNKDRMLSCWAYHGRPISAAVNKTVNHDAICWTAFVCNHDDHPPARPDDMGSQTSTLTTSPVTPKTSVFSQAPGTVVSITGQPSPTTTPEPRTGTLDVLTTVTPRFINWQNTWQSFISHFIWDQRTGNCVGGPIEGNGYTIDIACSGIQIDEDTHMTLLMIKALRDVGIRSLWFNQNPTIPGSNETNSTTTSRWVVMPEAFTILAMDADSRQVVGNLSYKTHYSNFLTGTCSGCETGRFNKDWFDPIIGAVQGSYPEFNNFSVEAKCDPWVVCK